MYPMSHTQTFINFGFWDVVRTKQSYPSGHFNRAIERKVEELGGIKSLYSDSYFPPDEFWRIYNGEAYRALKQRYDPTGVFKDLYAKCVLRH
jgi:FAD/FMN-containing dehydrogenase